MEKEKRDEGVGWAWITMKASLLPLKSSFVFSFIVNLSRVLLRLVSKLFSAVVTRRVYEETFENIQAAALLAYLPHHSFLLLAPRCEYVFCLHKEDEFWLQDTSCDIIAEAISRQFLFITLMCRRRLVCDMDMGYGVTRKIWC